jgi:anti-anti-sigma regulatory factor
MTGQTIQNFDLPAVVDLDSMDNVRDWLVSAFDDGDVDLNGAEVQRIATNALLMLVSAGETAGKLNVKFTISNPSTAFEEAVERLGFSQIFNSFRKEN